MRRAPQPPLNREFPGAVPKASRARQDDTDEWNLEWNNDQPQAQKIKLEHLVDPPALERYEHDYKTPPNVTSSPSIYSPTPHLRPNIYQFNWTVYDIFRNAIPLATFKNQICIFVNVASRSGFTISNYNMLTTLHNKYAESHGLRILAFPCNQFGGQEPGNADEIRKFAEERNVKFDLFYKINVNGYYAHPLWLYLQSIIEGPRGSRIMWNFTKFIVDGCGEPIARFNPLADMSKLIECLEHLW